MLNFPLPRLDQDQKLKNYLEEFCRLKCGDVWYDPLGKHKIGCLDVLDEISVKKILPSKPPVLAIHDPPYNMVAFRKKNSSNFINWCRVWINFTHDVLAEQSSLYVWLGANQEFHFEPFAEFIIMMKDTDFNSRSFITLRNQRGYGTQKNWMSVRQELLYYTKGSPVFNIKNVYTDIPKVVKGYYKKVGGVVTENLERSKSAYIRAGNVWADVQQVFHLMEENVNGCYAQKPLKALERIISVSSKKNDNVIDFFAHAGTTVLAAEKLNRNCFTIDIEPIYCEIAIRRLERFRETGKLGWQNSNPFENEILESAKIRKYLKQKYNITVPKSFN